MAGIAETDSYQQQHGLEHREIAGGDYLVFSFAGPQPEVSTAYDYIFGSWFSGSRYLPNGQPSFTRIKAGNPGDAARLIEIWIPVRAR